MKGKKKATAFFRLQTTDSFESQQSGAVIIIIIIVA